MNNTIKPIFSELMQRPTIAIGQADDLKIEQHGYRVWVSRMTIEDGMPYNNQVTIEHYDSGSGTWVTIEQYNPIEGDN